MVPDDPMPDDSSHYEISLTAGQAFTAFVLLLLSLALSFAFGIMIGKGRAEDRLVVRSQPSVIEEAEPAGDGSIVELGVPPTQPAEPESSTIVEEPPATLEPEPAVPPPATETPESSAIPHFAQLLSTREAAAAEALAARLIDDGYTSAYVERVPSDDGGMIYRVRVRFSSEQAARQAVESLRAYAPGEIWVSRL